MDCERFDQHVIDELYDELDELTHAALKRHVDGCSRCAGVYAGLRATRDVGILPLEEPPDDLEARILEAVSVAQRQAPWHRRVLRGLAWAGSHAMRPQLAMAALFFLVIGSSLLLLRARPGAISPVRVTERGAPGPDPAEVAAAPRAAAPASPGPVATAEAAPLERGRAAEAAPAAKAGGADVPPRDPEAKGSADEARAALAEARSLRDGTGCAAALPKLDAVAVAHAGTQAAADAMWDEASCYKQMGDTQKAQQIYLALRATGYRDRAEAEIAAADNNAVQNQAPGHAAASAPVVALAPAPPPPPPAAATAAATAAPAAAGAPAAAKAAKRPDSQGAVNPRAPAAPRHPLYDNAMQ